MDLQVKSRDRVSTFGEVFTAAREVNAMLDLVQDEANKITSTFLEPACGNGNFLDAIFLRKLASVEKEYGRSQYDFEYHCIEALASIYGIDIQCDNVFESRDRLLLRFQIADKRLFGSIHPVALHAAKFVLSKNIICGNSLTGLFADGTDMRMSEWSFENTGLVVRKEQMFYDILNQKDIYRNSYKYYWFLKTQAA